MIKQLKLITIANSVFLSLVALAGSPDETRSHLTQVYQLTDFIAATNGNGPLVQVINGVPQNVDIAKLTREAESGDATAQMNLAMCFYDGRHGVSTNYLAAYKWADLAASQKQKGATYLIRELELFMTPQQIAEGRAAAKKFLEDKKGAR